MTRLYTRLEAARLRPDAELAAFVGALQDEGAVASFVGLTRPKSASAEKLTSLFLDCYPGMTERSLDDIGAAALARFDVAAVHIVHRRGRLEPGEPIVFAAAASVHRQSAFEAAAYLMDRLKTEAVFWKREDGETGSTWIEPTAADHAARSRWSDTCRG